MSKLLDDILEKVEVTSISGETDREISRIAFDSREVEKKAVFVAIKGTQVDGHKFIEQAIQKGAETVVCEKFPSRVSDRITYIGVDNSALALSIMAANFYGNPSRKITLVAVTGTNGKTTVATILFSLFRKLGYDVGLLSTVENRINDEVIPATHTTPDPIQLNELILRMVDQGCTHCFMEASSHAIIQERISGLKYTGAIFTNISHDHLDYHKTFDAYIKAKKKLFDDLPASAFSLVNIDDKRGTIMQQNTKALKASYALKNPAEYKAKLISNTIQGIELEIENKNVWFKLIGDFNGYNLLASYATAILLGEDSEDVLQHLSDVDPTPGRFEQVISEAKITAIVDYAHTPDALKNVLQTINSFRTGNESLITIVGCGGDRDKSKRPLMASVACDLSNKVILTSDNPRNEDPEEILAEMKSGVTASNQRKTVVLANREEAIKTACLMAEDNDIILVAGKGHEKYQEIKGVKYPFDDKEVLERMLKLMSN